MKLLKPLTASDRKWLRRARRVLLLGFILFFMGLLFHNPAQGQTVSSGLTFLTNAVNLNDQIVTGAAWETIDVSSYVPLNSTGVLLTLHSTTTSDMRYGVRMVGSSDTLIGSVLPNQVTTYMVGLDASYEFELWYQCPTACSDDLMHGAASLRVELSGYTQQDFHFLTNMVNKATGTTGSYVDVNITADASPDTPTGAILAMKYEGSHDLVYYKFALRKDGSTDDRYKTLTTDNGPPVSNTWGNLWGAMIGVSSGIFEQKIESTELDLYLLGYTTGTKVTWLTNAIDVSPSVAGSWQGKDVTASTSANTTGVILHIVSNHTNYGIAYSGMSRSYGSTDDFYPCLPLGCIRAESGFYTGAQTDSSQVFEEKLATLSYLSVWLVGYIEGEGGVSTTTTTTTTTTPSSTTTTTPSGFDLPDVPDAIGDALGINPDAGGLLLSFILFFMVLVPLGMLTRNFWVILIAGLTLAGFLTAITWLPVWIMVMLCLITALMLGSRLTGLASRGGTDEGD